MKRIMLKRSILNIRMLFVIVTNFIILFVSLFEYGIITVDGKTPGTTYDILTMEDWKTKLDAFLRFNDAEVLQDKGKVTAAIAKEFAESEFEKYRVIQDSLYESDFDKLMNDMEKDGTND